jgi:LacI family transcriptional regulator
MKPNLQAIAERAGVSAATVSRALNDRAGVNPETRMLILELAQEMGYSPNFAARSLATARTYNLGCITTKRPPQPIPSYHTQIFQGIDHEAKQHGYHIITTFVDFNPVDPLPLISEQRVDGLILVGPAFSVSFIIQLYNSQIPLILVDNLLKETLLDAVVCDNCGGTYTAVRHLIEVHQRRNLIYLSGPADWFSSRERRMGYEQALAEIGQPPHIIYMPDTTMDTGYAAVLDLLRRDGITIEGIVAVNDAAAVGAIRACKENGLTVPGDVAVVGFDNVIWGPIYEPALTTVRMFKYETGIQAARRLIDKIERDHTPGFQLRLGTELVIRESCGCLWNGEEVNGD